MASIVPIPTTRVGDYFVRQRLASQVQSDSLALFELQNQVATGRRLQLPSDDAAAAQRVINLQRLLDRKDQIKTNIQSTTNVLSEAETKLNSVSQTLIDVRAEIVGVAGNLSTDNDRLSAIQSVEKAIESLMQTGNAKTLGRYLFSGSAAQTQPFDYNGKYVEYLGNEGVLRNYVDVERLFDTNLTGVDVFGGLSAEMKGSGLSPQVNDGTLLSTLNDGTGISSNPAIKVSIDTGSSTVSSIVDLGGATTLADVAHAIELAAPAGTDIEVTVDGNGLTLTTSSGTIAVSEVGQGNSAAELGILTPSTAPPSSTITGSALNPAILNTTKLSDLLGVKARGRIQSTGSNNDILLTANQNSTDFNDVRVVFVDDVLAGAETAVYDDSNPSDKTLTVHIQSGYTTATQAAAAISAEGTFTAVADYHDAISTAHIGTGAVVAHDFGQLTAHGSGEALDLSSGLIVTNGGNSQTLDTSALETVEDLLNLFNGADLGLAADINSARDGINLRSRLSGADLTIGENGGNLATQLGIRTYQASTRLEDFNSGIGVPTANDSANDDLLITARDGTQLSINLSSAKTVQDVINLINGNSANNTGTTQVLARLAATGNGIELVDQSTATTGDLVVSAVEGSQAAEYLGFVPSGQSQVSFHTVDSDGNYVLQSEDRVAVGAEGVFNTLIRLKQALEDNNTEEIGRSLDRLDTDIQRVSFAKSEIGSRLKSLDVIGTNLQDENVQLKSALSTDLDVDLVEAISNLTARQYSLQASLQSASKLLQLSLLNFI